MTFHPNFVLLLPNYVGQVHAGVEVQSHKVRGPWGMAALLKDKMIEETVNLLMIYLEVHSQIFEASESINGKKSLPIQRMNLWFLEIIKSTIRDCQKHIKWSLHN